MKKIYLLILLVSFSAFSQKKIIEINSVKLHEKRTLSIVLPPSYETNPDKKYPVLYLLDGDYLLEPFQGALNYGMYWDDLPEVILVGIHQDQTRYDDCTVDEIQGIPFEKGAQFFEFIGTEVVNHVDEKFRTSSFRIIAGHDTTAGFLNFYLYKENPLFNAYISLSPELAPKMEMRIPEQFSKIKSPIFYYQSSADGDIKNIKEPVEKLDQNIKITENKLINYKYNFFKNSTHYSLVLYSIPNALYQIFEAYKPINSAEFNDKIMTLETGFADYLSQKYEYMDKTLGIKIPMRMNDFKAIETAIMKKQAYDELEPLAVIANTDYPQAMLGEYLMGVMYEKRSDFKRAGKRYQVASQMEPIDNLNKDVMYEKMEEMNTLSAKK
ncbi:alpha/beta hydrolase [Flavobacterium agrisoli]|uniref:Alpha/beta hydrolase n=1 Tax=Flavobacterium agrisoli TaxID=2793066 RepID=A0A934PJV4_9FLAO|nr:alpha/beta hydrolase-fold protein [Flavobacterium agrisoli]MBK0369476.1 alpha/beta hydrolase [Flavobacterium agrisoli]